MNMTSTRFTDSRSRRIDRTSPLVMIAVLGVVAFSQSLTADDVLIIDDASSVYNESSELIIEETESDELIIGDDESEAYLSADELTFEDEVEERSSGDEGLGSVEMYESQSTTFAKPASAWRLSIDQVQLEWGHFTSDRAKDRDQAYAQFDVSLERSFSKQWSIRLEARADTYRGWGQRSGDRDWQHSQLDYGETYLRYSGRSQTFTLGTQQIIWGRIDEFPPTDRLSSQDLRRFVLDDLEQRRLASPALRYQHFFDDSQLDLVIYPKFREAELPDTLSSWFPVNKATGEVLGLETDAAVEALVRATPLVDDAPDSEGGFGLRYSGLGETFDYAFTLQKGRQTVPYFAYNPLTNTIDSRYPRTHIVGADFSFEGLGGTVKAEFAWLSDTPVTTKLGAYDTVESFSWGLALEIFPGDGDARLNLQLTGNQLLGAPALLERENQWSVNGSFETPFADNNWRSKIRFNVGLDQDDVYLNPELAYIGWDSHEAYVEFHYFDGDKGTAGGFYQDNSLATVGWRANY
ncbi:MAG: hypothetical protein ACRBBW_20280 [Cellvibrionaceae bacterium]